MTAPTPQVAIAHDAIFTRVKALPFFAGFTFAKTKALRVQTQDIPYCGVYFINGLMLPDGDSNAGDIRLRDSARIGFSVAIQDNQADDGAAMLHQAFAEITNGLLNDTSLTGFDRKIMQGITRGEYMHVFGSVALDNETPILELQFDMTVDLGVAIFKPVITDMLERVHVTARPMQNPDAPLIEMEWELETTTTREAANDNTARKNKSNAKSRRSAAASD